MTKSITEVNLNVDILEVEDITNRVDELRELIESAYTAGTNLAGYMPDQLPDSFATFDEAKRSLIETIKNLEEEEAEVEREELAEELCTLAEAINLESKPFSVIHAGRCYWVTEQSDYADERQELHFLEQTLGEMEGDGGNHQWEGNWYPDYLIADRHFKTYARELAEDVCSEALKDSNWPLNCIDWDEAAKQLQMDYTPITIDGYEFWYRA